MEDTVNIVYIEEKDTLGQEKSVEIQIQFMALHRKIVRLLDSFIK